MNNWITDHICNITTSLVVMIFGYFTPIKNVEIVVMVAIIFDFVAGLAASYKQGIGLKSEKMWRTVYKLFFALSIVMLLYAIDTEIGFAWIQTHRLVAWFICGFEVWSILENAAKISDHRLFRLLKKLMNDKIKHNVGVDLSCIDSKKEVKQNDNN